MNFSSVLFNEIIEEFDQQKNREARIGVLRKYGRNIWFKEFLNYCFNPKIQFDIIQIPDYKPAVEPAGVCYSNLSNEMRRLYIFISGHPKRTAKLDARREARILNALLGSIHKEEAALLVKCFKKDLEVRYLTPSLVKEAFPDLPFVLPQAIKEVVVEAVKTETVKIKKINTTGATIKV